MAARATVTDKPHEPGAGWEPPRPSVACTPNRSRDPDTYWHLSGPLASELLRSPRVQIFIGHSLLVFSRVPDPRPILYDDGFTSPGAMRGHQVQTRRRLRMEIFRSCTRESELLRLGGPNRVPIVAFFDGRKSLLLPRSGVDKPRGGDKKQYGAQSPAEGGRPNPHVLEPGGEDHERDGRSDITVGRS